MEMILDVNWLVVVVGAALSFILGAVWYTPSVFGAKWMKGLGTQAVQGRPLPPLLIAQFAVNFLFAWVLVLANAHSLAFAILIAVMVSGVTKVNGLFSGKSYYAISTESGYIFGQAVLILLVAYFIK
jgi:hypothetical protein